MAETLNFTKRAIEALPPASGKQPEQYQDKRRDALYLFVGKQAKTFYFYKKLHGEPVRVKIGRFPTVSVEQARKRALDYANQVENGGVDPNQAKREKRQRGLSFGDAATQYIEATQNRAKKPTKASTRANYKRSLDSHFKKWLKKSADGISHDNVQKWYETAAKQSASSANSALRLGRAIYYHQRDIAQKQKSGLNQFNPFVGIAMVDEKPRTSCIDSADLPAWFKAVHALSHETTRDYLIVLLLTGLRRREASTLKWTDINLRQKTLTVRDTKNGNDHTLPLSDYLLQLFTRRKLDSVVEWVFPGTGKTGHIAEPKTAITRIAELSSVDASPHALRRTFSKYRIVPGWHTRLCA